MIADKIAYFDQPRYRVLDLRPDGVACIPVLGYSDFPAVARAVDFHYHPGCMEFCHCLKGNLRFDTEDGRGYSFLPGHVFASSPDQPHHLHECPSGLKIQHVLFRIPKAGESILGLDADDGAWLVQTLTHLPRRLFAATADVRKAFHRLFETYDTVERGAPSRRVKMRAAALDLLVALVDAAARGPGKAPAKVGEIARRIRERPDADYPVAEMAAEAGLSPAAFATTFKSANGLPLHAYLLNCRIDRAKRLLVDTDRTIAAIARELRFYSTQHFARVFRRITGMNPTEFRHSN